MESCALSLVWSTAGTSSEGNTYHQFDSDVVYEIVFSLRTTS